jgi:hypothetical protein
MKTNLKIKMHRSKILLVAVVALMTISSCSQIINYYINPNFEKYNIKRVALLPMIWDDSTNEGTYFSTNHFINKIYDEREDVELTEIDSLRRKDYSDLLGMAKEIGNQKKIDVNKVLASPIGNYLSKDGCDAILVGTIDTCWVREKVLMDGWYEWVSTHCKFSYYLFSLQDGKLLWRIHMDSSADEYLSPDDVVFPPLDVAISEGIDRFFDKFPFKKKEINK